MGIEEIVLDSSAIVAMQVKEEYSTWVMNKLSGYFSFDILELTPYEVFNALSTYKRRGMLNNDRYRDIINNTKDFLDDCNVYGYDKVLYSALAISADSKIALYDSAYIALASKLRCKLLTVDLALYNKLSEFPALKELLVTPLNN